MKHIGICVFLRGSITHRIYDTWQVAIPKAIKGTKISLSSTYSDNCDYCVVDKRCSAEMFLQWSGKQEVRNEEKIVHSGWIIDSIKQRTLVDPKPYQHTMYVSPSDDGESESDTSTRLNDSSRSNDDVDKKEDEDNTDATPHKHKNAKRKRKGSITSDDDVAEDSGEDEDEHAVHSPGSTTTNQNQLITDKLDGLRAVYEASGDRWRTLVYRKASNIIRRLPRVTDASELDGINGIGSSIKDKVAEILSTGELQKLQHFQDDPKLQAMQQFMKIHGVGSEFAEKLYKKGFRTIDQLRESGQDLLTRAQRVGLKYWEDLQVKISREEVMRVERIVKEQADRIFPGTDVVVCGSYLRQEPLIGDIDFILTPPPHIEHFPDSFLSELVFSLEKVGFLTDHLSLPHGYSEWLERTHGLQQHEHSSANTILNYFPRINSPTRSTRGSDDMHSVSVSAGSADDERHDSRAENSNNSHSKRSRSDSNSSASDANYSGDTDSPNSNKSYMGICKLPLSRNKDSSSDNSSSDSTGDNIDNDNDFCDSNDNNTSGSGTHPLHMRIDIKTYPRSQRAFAIHYFTGPDHFERAMRQYAKLKGYKLNDKSASGKNVKVGPSIPCQNDWEIFSALGLEYREVWDRHSFGNVYDLLQQSSSKDQRSDQPSEQHEYK